MKLELMECPNCGVRCAACANNYEVFKELHRRLELAEKRIAELEADLKYERDLIEELDNSLKEGTHEVSCLESRYTRLRARIAFGRSAPADRVG